MEGEEVETQAKRREEEIKEMETRITQLMEELEVLRGKEGVLPSKVR